MDKSGLRWSKSHWPTGSSKTLDMAAPTGGAPPRRATPRWHHDPGRAVRNALPDTARVNGDAWSRPLSRGKVRLDMRPQTETGAGDPRGRPPPRGFWRLYVIS